MKKLAKVMLAVGLGIVFTVSVALAGDPTFSGFLGDQSVYKQLTPGPEDGAKLRWVKPGVDFSKYDKLMVDSVVFYLADEAQKGIDPQELKEIADSCNKELLDALKYKYTIVSEPAPDVARIRIAITNLEPSKPGVSAVTSIIPVGLGVSLIKKGATGGWTGSGLTGSELMVLDSMSNEVIAMAVDERTAAFESRFSKWGSVEDAFKYWAGRIVKFLDEAKSVKEEPAK